MEVMVLFVLFLSILCLASELEDSLVGFDDGQLLFVDTSKVARKLVDVAIDPDGNYAVLDQVDNKILVFSPSGDLIENIQVLPGIKGSLNDPRSIAYLGGRLWIADHGNSRILIRDGTGVESIHDEAGPALIASYGDRVFVTGLSLHETNDAIRIFDMKGRIERIIKCDVDFFDERGAAASIWSKASIVPLSEDRIFIGFIYENKVCIISDEGQVVHARSMDPFYRKYETQGEPPIFPAGYAVTSFSSGPNDTIIVSACDNEERKCGRILQFDNEVNKLLGQYETRSHVWGMEFFPNEKFFVILYNNGFGVYRTI
jgi:hypothetical protein